MSALQVRTKIASCCSFVSIVWKVACVLLCFTVLVTAAAQPRQREFPIGSLRQLDHLPESRLRQQLDRTPGPARQRALHWLQSFHFTEEDLPSLHADSDGGIFYACGLRKEAVLMSSEPPAKIEGAALSVSPFPESLIFHSKPGAPNVLYLNFRGEDVTNTEWNKVVNRAVIPAVAFSTDSDLTTFSASEQTAIKRIWQRVAEDYAPFDINVTTERPATFNIRTAHALITRSTDANGDPNPQSTSGGVAYVNVFNTIYYSRYRPAWVYHNNLGNSESYIAESASHEIGHNLGLSHDGTTDGAEYYSGHGSGDISWGPIMGAAYNCNVSQWCKGEYHRANNTQDDLATIAGKISYRPDDHGNTPGTATPLVLSNGTNVVSTTPENDPANTNRSNKGVLERNNDVDVFSFITGSGRIKLAVNPWIMASGARGGNLDLLLELYSEAGTLLLTNNPTTQTTALIETDLPEGRYYLYVRNSGAGDPLNTKPSGYTAYGSIGQYFITGHVVAASGFVAPPLAEMQITDVTQAGQGAKLFTVTYSDDVAIDVSTIDSNDIRIIGPNGYNRLARFVSVNATVNGTPRVATYAADPPGGGVWVPADNGAYTVWMESDGVGDIEGAWVAHGQLGQFQVTVPAGIYSANMDVDPGWTLEPQWQYGVPSYSSLGPKAGFSGTKIIAYNLSGNYADRLSMRFATTPAIDCSASASVTLRFQRWLRTRNSDTAVIQVSTNGSTWSDVWSTSSAVSDTTWQEVQYTLPAWVAGSSSVRLRWGLASNPALNDIGWNIDDVELLGDGSLDTTPPVASLNVANITIGGSPSHSCSVTYTDDTAVRLASLDSFDLLVLGPNGYFSLLEFVGADLPLDGTPITATYSIPAPGDSWTIADNGVYELILMDNEVEDIFNNAAPETVLGSFTVAILAASAGILSVSPEEGLRASGAPGGPFTPSSITYTLANSGGATLDWAASKTADWFDLSVSSGTLDPGSTTNLVVSLNSAADTLEVDDYLSAVQVVNLSSPEETVIRTIDLTVSPLPRQLLMLEGEAFRGGGFRGGPFVPESMRCVLTNASASTLTWAVAHDQNWVSASVDGGTLLGGEWTDFWIAFNQNADLLDPGEHVATLTVESSEGEIVTAAIRLQVWRHPLLTLTWSLDLQGLRLQIAGEPEQTFTVQSSPDMQNWEEIHSEHSGPGGLVELLLPSPFGSEPRFYRAKALEAVK
jgi:hypothetical protein